MAAPKTRKKQARRQTSSRKKTTPPWVWLLIGLLAGLIAALAIYLYTRTENGDKPDNPKPAAKQETTAKPKKNKSETATHQTPAIAKPRFDFYRLLPEREVVIPDEQVNSGHAKPSAPIPDTDKSGSYVLQAGAFKTFKQADQLKAKLALIGVEANIETVKINDTVAWHRVRVGPFNGLNKINTVRHRLQNNDIETVVLKVN